MEQRLKYLEIESQTKKTFNLGGMLYRWYCTSFSQEPGL
jgi:hypothetical protein